MNAVDTGMPPVHGFVDRDGRLAEADQRLGDLNARSGGAIGRPIAVPQLATLTRLAQRLGILIARSVVVADGDGDMELWVRADPNADGVRLSLAGWRMRTAWKPAGIEEDRDADFVRNDADWLWETDAALRLTFLSAAAGPVAGIDPATLLGQPLTGLFVLEQDRDGDFPMLGGLAMRHRFDDQSATLRATGAAVRLAATPRTDKAGVFAGFIGATRMVGPASPPPAMTPATTPSATPLAGEFAARLDHALRGPLGRIIANADSINAQSEGPLSQDYADYAADIASAGRHLMGLVEDLVDLQAIERPDFAVLVEPVDLADVARRAAGLLSVRASDARVRIDKPDMAEMLPASGEFRRALQVLVNLIGNAVRYSPVDGMVGVRTEREGDMACVIVADQGKGIAPADQARIFDKFERVDPREAGGSGLGLYIARRLARAMGGDVTVDSAPGQGARFVFTLPYRG